MYKSPIQILTSFDNLHTEISKGIDDAIVAKIRTTIGVDVDKEELIKALQYDRAEYEYGYKDGSRGIYPRPRCGQWSNEGNWWTEAVVDFDIWQCSYCRECISIPAPHDSQEIECSYDYCPHCGAYMKLKDETQ